MTLYKPTLILHGGAGNLERAHLPPDLYAQYHASLLTYLRSTKTLLDKGASALDAAVHAVSLMEDDPLFNCGRGSVFTSAGTIEMEASIMVSSVRSSTSSSDVDIYGCGGACGREDGSVKRGAGVMGLRNVRHPIHLARESLLRTGRGGRSARSRLRSSGDRDQDQDRVHVEDEDEDDGGSMHCQLVAPYAEDKAREWGLEFMPDEWFWTKRRWEEHRRGLEKNTKTKTNDNKDEDVFPCTKEMAWSQGTVGCVCLDAWGNLAVATSTGGLTNKWPGRIGDTPTLGAGFWAEAWEEKSHLTAAPEGKGRGMVYAPVPAGEVEGPHTEKGLWDVTLGECVASLWGDRRVDMPMRELPKRRAVAVSGTGNGDSFLRVAAARTACAMLRFSPSVGSLASAITAVAGPGGELQQSAGRRWGVTGEGEGGIIGIEAELEMEDDLGYAGLEKRLRRAKVVFDFNCAGMWRAWIEEGTDGEEIEKVMVYKEAYR